MWCCTCTCTCTCRANERGDLLGLLAAADAPDAVAPGDTLFMLTTEYWYMASPLVAFSSTIAAHASANRLERLFLFLSLAKAPEDGAPAPDNEM